MEPIPQEWIKDYIDQLLRVAAQMDERGALRASMLLRADNVMDMVKAFHERHHDPMARG
jgi:hypothetical protein